MTGSLAAVSPRDTLQTVFTPTCNAVLNLTRIVYSPARGAMLAAPLLALLAISCGGDRSEGTPAVSDSSAGRGATGAQGAGALRVESVRIGRGRATDSLALTATSEFRPTDTIRVAVSTTGVMDSAAVMLMVTYVADSSALLYETKFLSPKEPLVVPFTFWTVYGFKAGQYRAEVFLNGALADIQSFTVR